MRNNKVYRLTSVKTEANSLIFDLGNDASQIGKLGADDVFCPFLCVQKIRTGNDRAVPRFSKLFFCDESNRSSGGNFMTYGV